MGRVVPAVARALRILDLFLERPGSLSAPEVAEHLGLPRTSVHELLETLASRRYLVPLEGNPHRFALGVRLFELGSAYAADLDLVREGQQVARSVAAACDETVHLAILEGTEVVYIAKVDSTQAVRMVSAVGRRLPAHCTGVGKMLLSGLSEEDLHSRYDRCESLVALTPNSITSLDGLCGELAEVRRLGLALDNGEASLAVRCVAAPVFDHEGRMPAALSISVPTMRWSQERVGELSTLVSDGAAELARRLGYRPEALQWKRRELPASEPPGMPSAGVQVGDEG